MARADISTERMVHDAHRALAQSVWDRLGIRIQSVSFSWINVSTAAEPIFIVDEVLVETMTKK